MVTQQKELRDVFLGLHESKSLKYHVNTTFQDSISLNNYHIIVKLSLPDRAHLLLSILI